MFVVYSFLMLSVWLDEYTELCFFAFLTMNIRAVSTCHYKSKCIHMSILKEILFFPLVRMSACTCLHVAVMGHSQVSFLRSCTPWFWGRGLFTGLGLTSWARLLPSKSHKSCLSLSSAGIACTSCCPWFLCGCCGSAEFMLLWQALYWLNHHLYPPQI